MAHKIIGVDFGGAAIKLARFEAGFRKAVLLSVETRAASPLDPARSAIERLAARLAELQRILTDEKMQAEEVALAVPGELITFRTVDLPFNDPKRIESVLGYELEAQVLSPIEELVIDHIVVGARGTQTRVLVAAVPRAAVEAMVKTAAELALPVRVAGAAPLAYAAIVGAQATGLVLDVGYDATQLCALRAGRPELARTVLRGGRHFTDAIAAAFQLEQAAAEQAKVDAGFIAHAGLVAETPGQKRMDACLREAARPILRELKQTLAAYRAAYGNPIERVWLTGGGGQLPGLREHLAEETGLPVDPLPWEEREGFAAVDGAAREQAVVAVGVGLAAATPAPQVNFRKGEFSYRSDYSFLRGKALYLAGALLAVLACAAINAYASLRGLRREQEQLTTRLKRETTELFGQERLDARAVSDEVKGGPKGVTAPPIPTITAFDLLDEISRKVPMRDKVKLDVLELDIKPKKIYVKATAETAQQVDDLTDALKKIDCFEDVRPGKLSTVSAGTTASADGKETRTELKQFTLDISTSCP